jgi:Zn-dependent membrane protease YugP
MPISTGGSTLLPFLLLIIVPVLLGLWAQFRVRSTFGAAQRVPASSGLSGAEVAREIMRAHGITNVGVEVSHGMLSDHYDPRAKMLRLSPDVYNGRSVAALGIAAHEAGHALQDAQHYGPLKLRSGIVPLAVVGSHVSNVALLLGVLLWGALGSTLGPTLLMVGIAGLCLVALFQLITLPVEYDASRRAKDLLVSTGLVSRGREAQAMSAVLNAAALTYVAALVATLGTILYYALILFGGRRD